MTLRERDTTAQVRVPLARLEGLLRSLCDESLAWATVMGRFPVVRAGGDDEDEDDDDGAANAKAKQDDAAAAASTAATVVETTLRGMFSRPNPART